MALSRGWNRFSAFNGAVAGYPGFPNAAVQAPIKLVGDWNGDGRSDIALLGKAGWTTLPVALGERDGTFRGANPAVASSSGYTGFVADSAAAHVTALVGDFNHDGRDDIALVGGAGWRGFRVAFGNGDGTFTARDSGMMANGDGNTSLPNLAAGAVLLSFGSDAAMDGVVPLIGDFDGDGFRDDIALTGGAGWRTVPVAYGNGDGTFTGYKPVAPIFGANSGAARARLVADFDGDGRDDVALVGGTGWGTMPVILARGTGTWDEHNDPIGGPFASDFAVAATQPGARAFAGAF